MRNYVVNSLCFIILRVNMTCFTSSRLNCSSTSTASSCLQKAQSLHVWWDSTIILCVHNPGWQHYGKKKDTRCIKIRDFDFSRNDIYTLITYLIETDWVHRLCKIDWLVNRLNGKDLLRCFSCCLVSLWMGIIVVYNATWAMAFSFEGRVT